MRKTIIELIRENEYKKIKVSKFPYLTDSEYDLPPYIVSYVIDKVIISDFVYSRNCEAYSRGYHIPCSGDSDWVLDSVFEDYLDVTVRYPGCSWKVWPTSLSPGIWKKWPTVDGKIKNLAYPFYRKL